MQTVSENIDVGSLEALLAAIENEETSELSLQDSGKETQYIQSSSQAEYFLRVIKKYYDKVEEIKKHAEEQAILPQRQLEAIEAWRNAEAEKQLKKAAYFEALLEEYARRQLEGSKKKSIKLVEGVLSIRSSGPEIIYDDAKLIEWLNKYAPQYLLQVPKPAKAELKKDAVIKDGKMLLNGEIVDGIAAEDRPDKFSISW